MFIVFPYYIDYFSFIIKKEKIFGNNFAFLVQHGILYFMKTLKTILLSKQNKRMEQMISGILIFCSLIVFGICIAHGMGDDIWYDEVFSVHFMQQSYGEIAALTAKDVHPPMYYWYLKTFHDVGKILVPSASDIVLCKMASMLPFIGIFLYAFTLIQKRFGIKVMGFFLFLVAAMPQISNYTVEIRMYSLALFFITAIFLHGYELVMQSMNSGQNLEEKIPKAIKNEKGGGKKPPVFLKNNLHWAAFFLYGILTAYTQYYACIAVVAVYMALFVYFAIAKQKKQLGKVLLCAGLSVLCYLPWLPSFFWQFRTVSNSYWIQPLTFRSIFGCIKFVFLPVSYDTTRNYILAVVMILISGAAFLWYLWKQKDTTKRYFVLCGIWIPVFTAFMGFVCSALNRPIFVYRYLVPCMGAVWLVLAVCIFECFHKNWGILLLVPFILAGYSNINGFYAEEHKKIVEMQKTQEFLEAFPEDAVVLCNFDHVQALTASYLEETNLNYLYGLEPESLVQKMFPSCKGMSDVTKLKNLVETEDVYFFGSFNAREDLLAEWEKEGITYTEDGTYLLERYYFNVYHLKSRK